MTPEERGTIQSALKLQGDLTVALQKMGLGHLSNDIASNIMDMVMMSDVCKPEIQAIYKSLIPQEEINDD